MFLFDLASTVANKSFGLVKWAMNSEYTIPVGGSMVLGSAAYLSTHELLSDHNQLPSTLVAGGGGALIAAILKASGTTIVGSAGVSMLAIYLAMNALPTPSKEFIAKIAGGVTSAAALKFFLFSGGLTQTVEEGPSKPHLETDMSSQSVNYN